MELAGGNKEFQDFTVVDWEESWEYEPEAPLPVWSERMNELFGARSRPIRGVEAMNDAI